MMKKPKLNKIPLPNDFKKPGGFFVTMSQGYWDNFLSAAYEAGKQFLKGL